MPQVLRNTWRLVLLGLLFEAANGQIECQNGDRLFHQLTAGSPNITLQHTRTSTGEYFDNFICSAIVESDTDAPVYVTFSSLELECIWDKLFIWDGPNPTPDTLLGAYSGANVAPTTVTADSGAALVYFYSDLFETFSGWEISFSLEEPSGFDCREQTTQICNDQGLCSPGDGTCTCDADIEGENCSIDAAGDHFTIDINESFSEFTDFARARAVTVDTDLGILSFGGYNPRAEADGTQFSYKYDPETSAWAPAIVTGPELSYRYGHAAIKRDGRVIIHGGTTASTLTSNGLGIYSDVDLPTIASEVVDNESYPSLTGHCAFVDPSDDSLLLLFGYGDTLGFFPGAVRIDLTDPEAAAQYIVGEFNGDIPAPRMFMSCVQDPTTGIVYIHGGRTRTTVSSELFMYNPVTMTFSLLTSGAPQTYSSSLTLIGNRLHIIGGSGPTTQVDECYSNEYAVFDLSCRQFVSSAGETPGLSELQILHRKGHTAVFRETDPKEIFIVGGYAGRPLESVVRLEINGCNGFSTRDRCLKALSTCCWNNGTDTCDEASDSISTSTCEAFCADIPPQPCNSIFDADACNADTACQYCYSGGECQAEEADCSSLVPATPSCDNILPDGLATLVNVDVSELDCASCAARQGCTLGENDRSLDCVDCAQTTPEGDCTAGEPDCKPSCADFTTCYSCLEEAPADCLWCEGENRCVDTQAYSAVLPFGQCTSWHNSVATCPSCKAAKSCDECHGLLGCGWCPDPEDTGIGVCTSGTRDGPLDSAECDAEDWRYDDCPLCQCNGHSSCDLGSAECLVCENDTDGENCETCMSGFFGDPRNNGTCSECECNDQSTKCDSQGVCVCPFGYGGDSCDTCVNDYEGNATAGGICYQVFETHPSIFTYDVRPQPRYGFALRAETSDSDLQLQFVTNPTEGSPSVVNYTLSYSPTNEFDTAVPLQSEVVDRAFFTISRNSAFDLSNSTFYFGIEVQNPDTESLPVFRILWAEVQPNLNLLQFFATFFACFFALLFIAMVAWRIKVRIAARRTQMDRTIELQMRVRRPLMRIGLLPMEVQEKNVCTDKPHLLAVEDYYGDKKSRVVTVMVQMPTMEGEVRHVQLASTVVKL
eukprot:Clim_evm98s153 gene=Clim_evmTU98s153